MLRKQHGMIEWLSNISEYTIHNRVYDAALDSIARAVRSHSDTVVLYGREFDPAQELWDDAIRFIEANIVALTDMVNETANNEAGIA